MRHVRRPAGSGLNLRISGFAGAVVCPEDVLAALEPVPDWHLAGLRHIDFAPEEAGCLAPVVQAAYQQRARRICFYRLAPWPPFRHVLYHEIGHHVYALVVSSKVKTQWTQRAFAASAPASAYGATAVEEDFAECYARYLMQGAGDSAFAAKAAFMRELVFSGDPWTLKEGRGL